MTFSNILAEKKEGVGINHPEPSGQIKRHEPRPDAGSEPGPYGFRAGRRCQGAGDDGGREKAFCAGADIHEEAEISPARMITPDDMNRWRGNVDNPWYVANYQKPTICALTAGLRGGAYLAAALISASAANGVISASSALRPAWSRTWSLRRLSFSE